ncbi:MAG: Kelch repeat-containing protein [Planctomycetota bacterium]|jgi:N-acetylneuraminic acid mutarotase
MSTKTNRKECLIVIILMLLGLLGTASVSLGAGDTWTQKADLPQARFILSASTVDGKIYAIGGSSALHGSGLSTVYEYDPTTDTWTTKAPMPTARQWVSTSVVNGKIYAFGGTPRTFEPALSMVEEYDPATDTWTEKAPMPTARFTHSTSAVDGKIYVIGGFSRATRGGAEPLISTVEAYDPATDTWTEKTPMPTARGFVATSVVDGEIYAIGGATFRTGLSTVEEYDPATDTWSTKAPMPTARLVFSSSSVVNGIVYVIGGGSVEPAVSTVEAYDPVTDTWTTKTDMPRAIAGLATSVVGAKIYAIGGNTALHGAVLSTVYEYDTGLSASSPDFNGDGTVDIKDLLRLIESWDLYDPKVDIAPLPFGDGVVDALDLELLMSHWEQPIDDPTLIAHWALDEAEGTVAYDSAGVNDALLVGEPIWHPNGGQVAGALEFDGMDDWISASAPLNPAQGPFSVFAWAKGGAPGQAIISQTGGVNWLSVDSARGNLMTELRYILGRVTQPPLLSQAVITDGEWHRVGLVWDGAYRSLYVDDSLVAEDSQYGLAESTGGLNIGCGSDSAAGTFWSGLIDAVRIYDRAVSP